MKHLKKLTITLALAFTGVLASWAQDEYVTVDPTANANEWTFEMPDADVELEVTYYTDEEVAEMEEAAFTAGVELTKAAKGEWTLAEMPGFDIELEVEYETALALSEADDNTAALAEWNGYEADVTLTRSLVAGGWNTLAVPFDISEANYTQLQTLLTPMDGSIILKQLSSSELSGNTLTLNFTDATSIEAGKPYLVKVSSSVDLATLSATIDALAALNPALTNPFKGVIISKTAAPSETAYADFIPTLGLTEVSGDTKEILFVGSGNKLTHPSTLPGNMKGFRGYFKLKGDAVSANGFSLNLGEETTGIRPTPILADMSKGIKKIEVYGYAAPAGYSVALKDGTDDATSWQGKAGEGEYQALPLTGLEAGTAVTVKYNGTKKVKSVKAKKKQ